MSSLSDLPPAVQRLVFQQLRSVRHKQWLGACCRALRRCLLDRQCWPEPVLIQCSTTQHTLAHGGCHLLIGTSWERLERGVRAEAAALLSLLLQCAACHVRICVHTARRPSAQPWQPVLLADCQTLFSRANQCTVRLQPVDCLQPSDALGAFLASINRLRQSQHLLVHLDAQVASPDNVCYVLDHLRNATAVTLERSAGVGLRPAVVPQLDRVSCLLLYRHEPSIYANEHDFTQLLRRFPKLTSVKIRLTSISFLDLEDLKALLRSPAAHLISELQCTTESDAGVFRRVCRRLCYSDVLVLNLLYGVQVDSISQLAGLLQLFIDHNKSISRTKFIGHFSLTCQEETTDLREFVTESMPTSVHGALSEHAVSHLPLFNALNPYWRLLKVDAMPDVLSELSGGPIELRAVRASMSPDSLYLLLTLAHCQVHYYVCMGAASLSDAQQSAAE